MAFTNIMPDPSHKINKAGQADAAGVGGPGFEAVKLRSEQPMIGASFNSGRSETRSGYHHKWVIDISYNPLTCAEFHTIFGFLGLKRCTLEPFYVSIPPYNLQTLSGIVLDQTANKWDETILIDGTGATPGMIFTLSGNSKVYKVTRVETETIYDTDPGLGKERLHVTPPIIEYTLFGTGVLFADPLFKVMEVTESSSYSLDKDGLFNFSLSLEEVF